ncbi:hypothetical protein P0Q09_08400, partial [Campylobacter jejuni]|uniref:hypothetical protein n=1 Tax=Campylobacter jejuni TaxID=197 RepID=UPI002F963BD2
MPVLGISRAVLVSSKALFTWAAFTEYCRLFSNAIFTASFGEILSCAVSAPAEEHSKITSATNDVFLLFLNLFLI